MTTLAMQKSLLQGFIQSLYDEGSVNDQFFQLQAMKEVIRPDYVVRAVTTYCTSAQTLFSQLTFHINQPHVDFHQVDMYARDMYSRTSSIGAERVRIACAELVRACELNDRDSCGRALYWAKNEFSRLRGNLDTLVQMERRIIELQSGM